MQMVDGMERQAKRPGERLRGRHADEQGADEPRLRRDRDRIEVAELDVRAVECVTYDGDDELEMPPRRHLRHHTAESGV